MSLYIAGILHDIDNTDPENPVITELDGFFVNSTEKLAGLDDYLVTPAVPKVVFSGVQTYHYRFDSEQEAKTLLNYDAEEGTYNPEFEPALQPVPAEVTRRQALTVIKMAGLKGTIDTAIESITDDTQRVAAETYWQESLHFDRDNPLLNSLAEAVGITQEQLDNMFREAITL